ncbi:MAG TPA: AMP-binding protein [Intrasporangiaceae bacterium]|nr:AMP-binding protein [Intrasporangiaceae bacterium]
MSFETHLDQARIDAMTTAGYWPNEVLTDHLDRVAATTPDKLAFKDSRRSLTYAELKAQADRCALGLLELGVQPGDVVSHQLPNWIEFVVVHLACVRIGAVSNPLIPIYREREVGFMVGLAESKVYVAPREFRNYDYPAMVERLKEQLPSIEHVLVVDAEEDALADGHRSFEEFMATPWEERRDPAGLAELRPDPNAVALLIFTSGTTGEPKGVMHSHNTLMAPLIPIPERMGIDEDTVIHMASTFAHLTGFLYGVSLPIVYGQTCIVQDIWNATEFVDLVAEYGINYTSGATPFLVDLLDHLPEDTSGLQSLTRFCCMGAPIPRVMVRRAKEALPTMAVLGGWGQTENALVTIGVPGDPEEKITTDGRAWPGMEVRTVDLDDVPVAPDAEGRVQVRGPFLFVGYAKRPEMTRDLFTEDGWFDTGDLATLSAEGYLSISGRTKDIIVRGGENIPVAYVENVLYENPDYARVAVIAVPDPRLQERACACIVPAPGAPEPTLESVQDYLRGKGVAKQYWPERVVAMDDFPATASGKIQKFHLRDLFEKEGQE